LPEHVWFGDAYVDDSTGSFTIYTENGNPPEFFVINAPQEWESDGSVTPLSVSIDGNYSMMIVRADGDGGYIDLYRLSVGVHLYFLDHFNDRYVEYFKW
jgi:hypothetical protein